MIPALCGCNVFNGSVTDIPSYSKNIHDVTEAEAQRIVAEQVDGADESCITEFAEDYREDLLIYAGEMVYDGCVYTFEIDESTGNIIKWIVSKE